MSIKENVASSLTNDAIEKNMASTANSTIDQTIDIDGEVTSSVSTGHVQNSTETSINADSQNQASINHQLLKNTVDLIDKTNQKRKRVPIQKKESRQIADTCQQLILDPASDRPYYFNSKENITEQTLPSTVVSSHKEEIEMIFADINENYELVLQPNLTPNSEADSSEQKKQSKRQKTDENNSNNIKNTNDTSSFSNSGDNESLTNGNNIENIHVDEIPKDSSPLSGNTNSNNFQSGHSIETISPNQVSGNKVDRVTDKKSTQICDSNYWIIQDPSVDRPYFYVTNENKTVQGLPPEIKIKYADFLKSFFDNLAAVSQQKTASPSPPLPSSGPFGLSAALLDLQTKSKSSSAQASNDAAIAIASMNNQQAPSAERHIVNNTVDIPNRRNNTYHQNNRVPTSLQKQHQYYVQNQPQKQQSRRLGNSDQQEIFDETKKQKYFYNTTTEKTQWNYPLSAEQNHSITQNSNNTNHPINISSQQQTFLSSVNTLPNNSANNNGNRSGSVVQAMASNPTLNRPKKKTSKQLGNSHQQEIDDPDTDQPYYYNTKSQKTQWERPQDICESRQKKSKQLGESQQWEIDDPSTTKKYYYNAHTHKTQQECPVIVGSQQPAVTVAAANQQNLAAAQQNLNYHQPQHSQSQHQPSNNSLTVAQPVTSPYFYTTQQATPTTTIAAQNPATIVVDQNNQLMQAVAAGAAQVQNRRAPYNSHQHVSIASTKCNPNCETKAIAQALQDRLYNVSKQKKNQQQKFIEAQDKISLLDSSRISTIESTTAPITDNLTKPIPDSFDQLRKDVFESIETVGRNTLFSALSTTDLRQALLLKASIANHSTLKTLFEYLYQPPLESELLISSSASHPTYSKSQPGNPRDPFDINRSYTCFICSRRFFKPTELTKHMRIHTEVLTTNTTNISNTSDVISDNNELQSNKFIFHKCSKCSLQFLTRLMLNLHSESHSNDSFSTSKTTKSPSVMCLGSNIGSFESQNQFQEDSNIDLNSNIPPVLERDDVDHENSAFEEERENEKEDKEKAEKKDKGEKVCSSNSQISVESEVRREESVSNSSVSSESSDVQTKESKEDEEND